MNNRAGGSGFSFRFRNFGGAKILVIIDLDEGGMTVTNNVTNVLRFIEEVEGEEIYDNPIIYRDSEGNYDGIEAESSDSVEFYYIGTEDEDEAIAVAVRRAKEYEHG